MRLQYPKGIIIFTFTLLPVFYFGIIWNTLSSFFKATENHSKIEYLAADDDDLACMCDPVSDSLALVALYNATDGANWDDNTNWLVQGQPIGTWFGVTTNADGCVRIINLQSNNLSGFIPLELEQLFSLTRLFLNNNALVGNIPTELGQLSNLMYLFLSSNTLVGNIPTELSQLSNLTHLYLSGNMLEGNIPSQLGQLSNLEFLLLHNNNLGGNIPFELGYLSNLETLQLYRNQLEGTIPTTLGDLSNLIQLQLQENQLSGSIPTEIGNLSNLTILNLSDNQLSGNIPVETGNLSNLTILDFGYNLLSGNIPAEIGNLSNLIQLILINNQLSGNIPANIGNLNNLEYLYLQSNQLEGCFDPNLLNLCSVPFKLIYNPLLPNFQNFCDGLAQTGSSCNDGNPSTTNDIIQNDCSCSGTVVNTCVENDSLALVALYNATDGANWYYSFNWLVPGEPIGNWYGVTTNADGCVTCLDLDGWDSCSEYGAAGNGLIGTMPSELGNLSNLTELYLSDNTISGTIPSELGNLGNLTNLFLNQNSLSGNIPPELGGLSNLEILNLGFNSLSGNIPSELGNLSNLTELHLLVNSLSGSIPPELGNLSALQEINLGLNDLSGSIPSELGNLSNLTWLELELNSLTGTIPSELGNLSNLVQLWLNDNSLTGNIPPELGSLSNLSYLHLENNELEGCFAPELMIFCSLGFSDIFISPGYNFTGNIALPWQGDFDQFCVTGGSEIEQYGAVCDDSDANTTNDIIQNDCSCAGVPEPCADVGTITVDIDGVIQPLCDTYNLAPQSNITFTSTGYTLPPAGLFDAGIGFAIFSCDPSIYNLNDPATYNSNNTCFLDMDGDPDQNFDATDRNCAGNSASESSWPSQIWIVAVTLDYDCNTGGFGCGWDIDINNDECIDASCPMSIIYEPHMLDMFGCGDIFTDSGGSDSTYCSFEMTEWSICPDVLGESVTVDFTLWELEEFSDQLLIYDGNSTTSPLIGTYSGSNSPGTVTSTDISGCLYFVFQSDEFVNQQGWEASISCASEIINNCMVTNTDDSGAGSLREAINCAESNPGLDTIFFNIPGSPPHQINLASVLPSISNDSLVLNVVHSGLNNGDIILDGTNATDASYIFNIYGNSIHISGLQFQNKDGGGAAAFYSLSSNCIFSNNTVLNTCKALRIRSTAGFFIENNTITNTIGQGCIQHGIWVTISSFSTSDPLGVHIINNTISECATGVNIDSGQYVRISQNSLFCNSTPINLVGTDPNNNLAAPTILSANETTITGTASANETIEVFISDDTGCSPFDPCQGKYFLGSTTSNAFGNWELSAPFNQSVSIGDEVTSTTTDTQNNTSRFSSCFTVEDICASFIVESIEHNPLSCDVPSTDLFPAMSQGNNFSFSWSGPANFSSDEFEPTVVLPGDYFVTVTNEDNACTASSQVTVEGDNSLPLATINIANNGVLNCTVAELVLDGSASDIGPEFIYEWTDGNGNVISNMLTTIDEGAGLYTLTVTNTDNGCSSSDQVEITEDFTPPFVAIAPVQTIDCDNSPVTLDGSISDSGPDFTYQWTNDNGDILGSDPIITVSEPGNYTLTIENSNCGSATFVSVDQSVPPFADAVEDYELTCNQLSVYLDGSNSDSGPNISYRWRDFNGNEIATTQTVEVYDPGEYTLEVIDNNTNCSSELSVDVWLNADLPFVDAGTDQTIDCINEVANLDGSASDVGPQFTYEWIDGNGNFITNMLTTTISNPNTYTLIVTNINNGCSNIDQVEITEDFTPPLAIIAPVQTIDCDNSPVTIDGSNSDSGPEITYQWTNDNGDFLGIDPIITVSEPGNYMLSIFNATNNCESLASVSVDQSVPPFAAAIEDYELTCDESSVYLDGSNSDSGPNISYRWLDFNGNEIATTQTVEVYNPGEYTLEVIDNITNCSSELSVEVWLNADLPFADAGIDQFITCETSIALLNGTNSDSGLNIEYTWYMTNGAVLGNQNILEAELPGEYTLEVLNTDNGCRDIDQVLIIADNNLPAVNAGVDGELTCAISSILLDGSGSDSSPEFIYAWTTTNGNIVGSTNTPFVDVDAPGSYTLNITNTNNGCVDSDEVIITENNSPPSISINASGDLDCSTPSVDLESNTTAMNVSYSWRDENMNEISTNPIANVISSGIYTLIITDEDNGCNTTDQIEVQALSDTQAPIFDNLPNTIAPINCEDTFPIQENITASDNCDNVTVETSVDFTEDICAGYTVTYRWIVEDNAGNEAEETISFDVLADTEAPVFDSTPMSISDISCDQILPNHETLTASDNCSVVNISTSVDPYVEDLCNGYSVTYRWLATDACGNSTAATQSFNVMPDNTAPVFDVFPSTLDDISCDELLPLQEQVTVSDNCGAVNITPSIDPYVEDLCNGYTITYRWTIADACGNTHEAIQTLNVFPCENLPTELEASICDGENYLVGTTNYNTTGTFTSTLTNSIGCDSVVLLDLMVADAATLGYAYAGEDQIVCENAEANLIAYLPPNTIGEWTNLGIAEIEDNTIPTTTAFGLEQGLNEFIWSLSTAECSTFDSDTIQIIYEPLTPITENDAYTIEFSEDFKSFNVSDNDELSGLSDWEIEIIEAPEYGELINEGEGQFTFTPSNNTPSAVYFSYQICNSYCNSLCDQANVTIFIKKLLGQDETVILTPYNQDGLNDVFIIDDIQNYPDNEVIIFNRWGSPIFTAKPYKNDWGGQGSNGKLLPEGTYYYEAKLNIAEKEFRYGAITIKR